MKPVLKYYEGIYSVAVICLILFLEFLYLPS